MTDPPILLLDACALINLYASRRMDQILGIRSERFAIVPNVYRESRFVFRGGNAPDSRTREPIEWSVLKSSGLLELLDDLSEEEAMLYLDLALELGDGEAMTGAVASHRGYGVVSDDMKATRLLGEIGITVTSSLDLVANWARTHDIHSEELQAVVMDIRLRARYLPPRSHSHYQWWVSAIDPGNSAPSDKHQVQ